MLECIAEAEFSPMTTSASTVELKYRRLRNPNRKRRIITGHASFPELISSAPPVAIVHKMMELSSARGEFDEWRRSKSIFTVARIWKLLAHEITDPSS